MLDAIEKLLVLQDRDRKILRVKDELKHIEPERQQWRTRAAQAQTGLDEAKLRVKHLESERKRLELEADGKRGLIEKYSVQQYQTKRNEEYRALTHEIDLCKAAIRELEDQQLDFMEQGELAQKQVAAATQTGKEIKQLADSQIADLDAREQNLKKELAELETNRGDLADAVEDDARMRYERLSKQKGHNVVVGIERGVCGGCHMRLNPQIVVSCRAEQEIVTCPNCGRILYYTRDMDMVVAD
jgi:predicted  nucleic acid-binding Zn-ribbon protein